MDINAWFRIVQRLLSRLKDMDLGYPLGENKVFPPQQPPFVERGLRIAEAFELEELRIFYSCCDGLSLPDVHVGYFIKSVAQLGAIDPSSEPVEVTGEFGGKVVPFGSTGGGGLFVIRRISGIVLHLAPGPLDDGVYDGNRGRVKMISANLSNFLDRLVDDIEAFVEYESRHAYIC